MEVTEDKQENKDIIDAEGFLDEIAGQKLESNLRTSPKVDAYIEEKGQGNPDAAPYERFFNPDRMALAMEYPKVQSQHS